MMFTTTATTSTVGYVYTENMSQLTPTGYLTTGNIRFNTLEKKNFKRLLGRGNFTYGSMTLNTVDEAGTVYDVISYDASVGAPEVTTSSPSAAQEYLAYKFITLRTIVNNISGHIYFPIGYTIFVKINIYLNRRDIQIFKNYGCCLTPKTSIINILRR